MKSLNRAIVGGRLGQNPEISYFSNGNKVSTFNIACSYAYKKDDEWQEKTDWIKCKAFGYIAERTEKFKKGDFVIIEGNIKTDTWEDEKGNKRSMTYINIRDCMYVPTGSKTNENDAQSPKVLGEDDVPF